MHVIQVLTGSSHSAAKPHPQCMCVMPVFALFPFSVIAVQLTCNHDSSCLCRQLYQWLVTCQEEGLQVEPNFATGVRMGYGCFNLVRISALAQ